MEPAAADPTILLDEIQSFGLQPLVLSLESGDPHRQPSTAHAVADVLCQISESVRVE